ncbi:ferric-dicitrate binding protein FerR (iron transport regulator) [Bradyrhizobium sp. AZCC 2289]
MTQADRVHSTPPTNMPADPTRRHFLSQSAGVAAGGAVLALATVSASADATAPMAALAPSDVDPIFSLIEDYRTARPTGSAS